MLAKFTADVAGNRKTLAGQFNLTESQNSVRGIGRRLLKEAPESFVLQKMCLLVDSVSRSSTELWIFLEERRDVSFAERREWRGDKMSESLLIHQRGRTELSMRVM